jgi:hypothetical protein
MNQEQLRAHVIDLNATIEQSVLGLLDKHRPQNTAHKATDGKIDEHCEHAYHAFPTDDNNMPLMIERCAVSYGANHSKRRQKEGGIVNHPESHDCSMRRRNHQEFQGRKHFIWCRSCPVPTTSSTDLHVSPV